MGYTVAVMGATGNVGRELLSILAEREFPVEEVIALASSRSVGREVSFGEDDVLKVENLDEFDFTGVDIVLSSPGASVSSKYAPIAAEAGRRGHRQYLLFPHGSGRAAGGAGSEPRCHSRLQEARDHRQSKLFNHSDGGGPKAAP